MKKIFIILIGLGLVLSSCEKFLEEDNRTDGLAEDFYLTAEGYSSLINANYSQLREIFARAGVENLFCDGVDIYSGGRGASGNGLNEYTTLNSTSNNVDDLYIECYKAIQLVNTALAYADKTEQTELLTEQVGEVKYLRALSFFLLVETYGGVPIVEDYIQEYVKEFGRNTEGEVYNFIIKDLSEAATALVASTADFNGKVNLRAVKNLQGYVYLTRAYKSDIGSAADFTTAANLFTEVIGGQALDIPFDELWSMDNQLNDETIFSVGWSTASIATDPTNLGSTQNRWFGPYMGGTENAHSYPIRSYQLCATPAGLSLFTEDDDRYYTTFMVELFQDTTRADGGGYFDYYRVEDHSTLKVQYYYAPQWVDQAEQDAYAAAHPGVNIIPYPDHASAGNLELDFAGIAVKKFDDPTPETSQGSRCSTRDVVVHRLADTYLLLAEAQLGAGSAANALTAVNVVRARANTLPAVVADIDIDYILDERARELWGEYHRWFDLKRTGKLIERASRDNYMIDEANFVGVGGNLKILRPIPQQALDLNQSPDFYQNPAYAGVEEE